MKIRNGFVSNSSSSSFIIVGKSFQISSKQEVVDLLTLLGHPSDVIDNVIADINSECGIDGDGDGDGDDEDCVYITDYLSDILCGKNPKDLKVEFSCEDFCGYVGKSVERLDAMINLSQKDVDELSTLIGEPAKLHFGEINN